jgi:hypothetical protein
MQGVPLLLLSVFPYFQGYENFFSAAFLGTHCLVYRRLSIQINPEDGNYHVCRNVGKVPTFDAAFPDNRSYSC